jgi:elongation factor 1-beta
MQAFTISNQEGINEVEAFLAENSYLSGGNSPSGADADLLNEIDAAKFVPSQTDSPNLFGWWWTLCPFRANARELWRKGGKGKKGGKKAAPKKEAAKKAAAADDDSDDDSFDPFADNEELDAINEQKKKEEADKKKKKKKKKEAKSIITFEVKGYEVEYDWDALAKKIFQIEMDGLTWMDAYEVLPLAFGMKKLQMQVIVSDEKVQTDDIWEQITAWEDDVQSVDVVKFDKA